MALYTDGPVSSIEELTARDSQLLSVASTEAIDLTQKLALAQDEIGLELIGMLTSTNSLRMGAWTCPETLQNVVVTPALKLWHTLRTLDLVYCDAYHNELNDRYAGKRDQFRKMARRAYERFSQMGIGIVSAPVARASAPDVTVSESTTEALPDGTYYIATAWVNRRGEEGSCASPAVITTSESSFTVSAGAMPRNGAGWNVYVGSAPEALNLQNDTPLADGTIWRQPSFVANGRQPGPGQQPDIFRPVQHLIQRG